MTDKPEDFGKESDQHQPAFETLNQKDLLGLAKTILAGLFAFAGIAVIAYCVLVCSEKQDAAKVFETLLLTVIPSFVTFILGFYFSKKLH